MMLGALRTNYKDKDAIYEVGLYTSAKWFSPSHTHITDHMGASFNYALHVRTYASLHPLSTHLAGSLGPVPEGRALCHLHPPTCGHLSWSAPYTRAEKQSRYCNNGLQKTSSHRYVRRYNWRQEKLRLTVTISSHSKSIKAKIKLHTLIAWC